MTKDQRQIFRTMDGNRAQEIREAYYKAIEGLMTLAMELEMADADLAESPTPLLDEHMYALEALAAMDKANWGRCCDQLLLKFPGNARGSSILPSRVCTSIHAASSFP